MIKTITVVMWALVASLAAGQYTGSYQSPSFVQSAPVMSAPISNPASGWGSAPAPAAPVLIEPQAPSWNAAPPPPPVKVPLPAQPVWSMYTAPVHEKQGPMTYFPHARPIQVLLTYTIDQPNLSKWSNFMPQAEPVNQWATFTLKMTPFQNQMTLLPQLPENHPWEQQLASLPTYNPLLLLNPSTVSTPAPQAPQSTQY